MKRWLAFFLAALMVLSCAAALADTDWGDAYYAEREDIFGRDIDEENDVCFVVNNLFDAEHLSFLHKYESDKKWSYMYNDILMRNYSSPKDRFALHRTWLFYCIDGDPLNFNAISFIVDGMQYTFSGDVAQEGWITEEDGTSIQRMLIKFGTNSTEFYSKLVYYAMSYTHQYEMMGENAPVPRIRMIFHGDEDIEVTVPGGYLREFASFYEAAQATDSPYWTTVDGTDMTASRIN